MLLSFLNVTDSTMRKIWNWDESQSFCVESGHQVFIVVDLAQKVICDRRNDSSNTATDDREPKPLRTSMISRTS